MHSLSSCVGAAPLIFRPDKSKLEIESTKFSVQKKGPTQVGFSNLFFSFWRDDTPE